MVAEKEKFVGKVITFKGARAAFVNLEEAVARKGKDGQPRGKPKFRMEVLLDPTNKDHAATIAEIIAESVRALNHRFGTPQNATPFTVQHLVDVANAVRSPPNFYLSWGYGNKLPEFGKKLYDGYADMFYLKLADENRPNLAAWRDGKAVPVVPGEKDFPYGGCYVAGTTTMYSYDNESRGVGSNLRTIVFQRPGTAFGGGTPDAQQEYAALGDLGGGSDPFVGNTGSGAAVTADPFAI